MRYIRLHSYNPFNLTVEEYEQILKDLEYRHILGSVGLIEQIVARLISDNSPRYYEIKTIEKEERNEGTES